MVEYYFEWDPQKARQNVRKHGVSFEKATTVFRDSRAASLYDDEHSEVEDRWVTLGIAAGGGLLVVHHTFEESDATHRRIRIFSSRKATPEQIKQYAE